MVGLIWCCSLVGLCVCLLEKSKHHIVECTFFRFDATVLGNDLLDLGLAPADKLVGNFGLFDLLCSRGRNFLFFLFFLLGRCLNLLLLFDLLCFLLLLLFFMFSLQALFACFLLLLLLLLLCLLRFLLLLFTLISFLRK